MTGSRRAKGLRLLLNLKPHPEGGWFAEHYRAEAMVSQDGLEGDRTASTSIYFMLEAGDVNRPHRILCDETWHFYEGAPLELTVEAEEGNAVSTLLAPPPRGTFAYTVPAGHWMSARSLGSYTLVGCTVAPGFEFEDLEFREPIEE